MTQDELINRLEALAFKMHDKSYPETAELIAIIQDLEEAYELAMKKYTSTSPSASEDRKKRMMETFGWTEEQYAALRRVSPPTKNVRNK